MTSVQILAAVGNGLFVVAMLVASVRLLLLWRRTRRFPELAVGLGFFLIAALGYPLMAIAGTGGPRVGDVAFAPLCAGLLAVGLGLVCLQAFNWQTFRPRQAWAAALVVLSLVGAIAVAFGGVLAVARAPLEMAPTLAGRGWWLGLRLLFEAWYVWTAVEGLGEHARARRRLALGLSDPVIVNRFLIFGAMGSYLAVNGAIAMVLEYRGMGPLTHLGSALLLTANGLGAGILIILAFMPPKTYLERVRARAAAEAA